MLLVDFHMFYITRVESYDLYASAMTNVSARKVYYIYVLNKMYRVYGIRNEKKVTIIK